MRHPLWIVNSSLLVLFLCSLVFFIFARPQAPRQVKLEPIAVAEVIPQAATPFPLSDIYNNDLFNTFPTDAPSAQTPEAAPTEAQFPEPPAAVTTPTPQIQEQVFLPPLNITLKGIMLVDDYIKSAAIIADNATKKEDTYHVGDQVEDAELIRILHNRIIFVRSNGQQEIMYLNEKEINPEAFPAQGKNDMDYLVKKIVADEYSLDPESFIDIFPNLAHCIDTFDLITVYKNGKSVGCRIGANAQHTLTPAFGFEINDIIKTINRIDATTLERRMEIYNQLISLKDGDVVTIELERQEQPLTVTYTLRDLKNPIEAELRKAKKEKTGIFYGPGEKAAQQEQVRILQEQYKLAPTEQEIRIQQKQAMLQQQESAWAPFIQNQKTDKSGL